MVVDKKSGLNHSAGGDLYRQSADLRQGGQDTAKFDHAKQVTILATYGAPRRFQDPAPYHNNRRSPSQDSEPPEEYPNNDQRYRQVVQ